MSVCPVTPRSYLTISNLPSAGRLARSTYEHSARRRSQKIRPRECGRDGRFATSPREHGKAEMSGSPCRKRVCRGRQRDQPDGRTRAVGVRRVASRYGFSALPRVNLATIGTRADYCPNHSRRCKLAGRQPTAASSRHHRSGAHQASGTAARDGDCGLEDSGKGGKHGSHAMGLD